VGLLAITFLVGKTVLSIFFTHRGLKFLSAQGANIFRDLLGRLLNLPILQIQNRTTQQLRFALTEGINALTVQVLGSVIVFASDISLLLFMIIGLIFVDLTMTIASVSFFVIVALVLYRLLNTRATIFGKMNTVINIEIGSKLTEVLHSYREVFVSGRRGNFANSISSLKDKMAVVEAERSFMPYIGKYVLEASVVSGAVLLGIFQYFKSSSATATTTLAIFLAAGTRIAPAILRLQQTLIQIRGGIGAAHPTIELISELRGNLVVSKEIGEPKFNHDDFLSEIIVSSLDFSYPSSSAPLFTGLNLEIKPGEWIALVGPSGSGKTTLVDLIVGVIKPNGGEIKISGLHPEDAVNKWPGAISYVPQDAETVNGTLRENLIFGFNEVENWDQEIYLALNEAALTQLVTSLPDGLDSQAGERGTKLSGGQNQRLGIARALFTKPKLLVLDEATSALDGETESVITSTLSKLHGKVTIVSIAHRLSTVLLADRVIYLENGQVIADGDFEYVKNPVSYTHLRAHET
jgi:ABC-type multidrug transport system fused ATPase/permease subunit